MLAPGGRPLCGEGREGGGYHSRNGAAVSAECLHRWTACLARRVCPAGCQASMPASALHAPAITAPICPQTHAATCQPAIATCLPAWLCGLPWQVSKNEEEMKAVAGTLDGIIDTVAGGRVCKQRSGTSAMCLRHTDMRQSRPGV